MAHHVVFISPLLDKPGKFHDLALRYMKIAATSLGVEVNGLNATEDVAHLLRELLDGPERPDGAVVVNARNLATPLLDILNRAEVPTVMAFESFYETDRNIVGEPGLPYEHWRCEIMPDDRGVGRMLARTLLDRAIVENRREADGKIRVLTLSGPFTQAATNRLTGFRETVREYGDQVTYDLRMAGWSRGKGHRITAEYLQTNRPQVIWAANDSIAQGAAQALEDVGLNPGEDVLLGGIDWLGDSLEQVADGRITTSVGGHILDGIWALVMVCDALAGHPPPADVFMKSSMVAATADDASTYSRVVDEDCLRRIDFAERFSSTDGQYDFSLNRLLD
ncbi:MAG: substrate-binding domain-containing protein [Thermoanaerobaculia bacterium]|nr:substrate-binding domain-containing protein [Thermoanaerobaculia bacterium]